MDVDARDFGRLEGEVQALRDMITAQNLTLASLQKELALVNQMLSETKGGWRTLLWLLSASATVGSAVTWLFHHLQFGQ